MDSNINLFSEKSPENISFLYIDSNIKQLFGEKIIENNKYNNKLINYIKIFILNSQSLPETLKSRIIKFSWYNWSYWTKIHFIIFLIYQRFTIILWNKIEKCIKKCC